MIIGNGQFLQGDCLELMREMPDGSVDMILCDLPYGTTACKWDEIIPFEPLWEQYKRILSDKSAIVLTSSQPFTSAVVMSNPKHFRHEWIWNKNRGTNPFSAKFAPMKRHESVLVFGYQSPRYFPQMRKGKPYGGFSSDNASIGEVYGKAKSIHKNNPEGLLLPVTLLDFDCEFGLHPTQKPVALFEYLIRTYTNEGEHVLDNTAGSGTTAIAAENSGRRWTCIERDQTYYEAAVRRVSAHVSIPPVSPYHSKP